MPKLPKKSFSALREKLRAERIERLATFSLSPIIELRKRLNECADSDVHEPPAELEQSECRALRAHLDRLEHRYNFLWRVAMGTDTGREVIERVEKSFNEPDAFNPESVGNWGR